MNIFIRGLNDDLHLAIKITTTTRGETMGKFIERAIKAAVARDPVAANMLRVVRKMKRSAKRSPGLAADQGR